MLAGHDIIDDRYRIADAEGLEDLGDGLSVSRGLVSHME